MHRALQKVDPDVVDAWKQATPEVQKTFREEVADGRGRWRYGQADPPLDGEVKQDDQGGQGKCSC